MLTAEEKKKLIEIARSAIASHLSGTVDPPENDLSPGLKEERGAFVSLHKGKHLRGCIGTFQADKPLCQIVHEMAVAASSQDPRFVPVGIEELKDLKIEISVLSPLKEIKDPSEIVIGRHGLYIIKGRYRGVLLPQVAVEHGFDVYTFLDETCMKAGLLPGDWKKGAAILTFEADIIEEN